MLKLAVNAVVRRLAPKQFALELQQRIHVKLFPKRRLKKK
jgi:hypothetical protein